MTRFLATIAALALMLPATAEAAKFRGGRSAKAEKPASRSTLIVAPGLAGAAGRGRGEHGQASAPSPPRARSRSRRCCRRARSRRRSPWCRSGVVAGGFCVIN
jgi:hypothetical protein